MNCVAYDTSPLEALEAIERHDDLLLIDLDETLYLGNSTEDFIDLARPGLLALVALRILDAIRPWRWSGGESTRDNWRVGVIRTLFPWTQLVWRRNVDRLAAEFCNRELAQRLQAKPHKVVIVTLGFLPIVRPLVAALGFADVPIIASRPESFEDRRRGKLQNTLQVLGQEKVSSSLLLTDSLDDLPLLEVCARALRTIWPGAKLRPALSKIYLPGQYVARVKHPGQRYTWRVIVQEDLAFWILSSVALAPSPLLHSIGLAALLFSFWSVYERGYVDNDWAAEHLEDDGKLSHTYWHAPVATPMFLPWVWATLSGALAVYLLHWPNFAPLELAKWLGVLLLTYGAFKIYNRTGKPNRTLLYAVLQFARATAFIALVPASAVGVAALGALILARWVAYYVYRLYGGGWPDLPASLIRLLFFIVLISVQVVVDGPGLLVGWTAPVILAWNILRARGDLSRWFERRRLSRSKVSTPP